MHGIAVILVYDAKNIKISDRYKNMLKKKIFNKIITSIKKDLLSLKFTDKDCKLVFKIIDNISYSKEKKTKKKRYKN